MGAAEDRQRLNELRRLDELRARRDGPQGPSTGEKILEGAEYTGAGMLGAAGAFALRGVLRKIFPGALSAKVGAFKDLNAAIKRADSSSGLKEMVSDYMREVSETGKPISFADYVAQRPGHADAARVIKSMISRSGNIPAIEEMLAGRSAETKQRVLDDLAGALGIKKEGFTQGIEALKKQRAAAADPLYAEAFKDKRPIQDVKMLRLFGEDTPNMAMMRALKKRIETLALKGEEPPSLSAADPARRDAWKRLATTDVPEQLFAGQEWKKLRPYYAPSIEDLHWMRRNLWDQRDAALRSGDSEAAKAYKDAWSRLTDYLDTATQGSYRKARQTYKGDSDMMSAYETGADLLKLTPDEARAAIKKMAPPEREALASGFFAGLNDMNHQKLLRELVARPDRYPETRAKLSAVFQDQKKLDQFLSNLRGEEAMTDSAAVYGAPPPSRDAGPRLPWLRVSEPMLGAGEHASPKLSLMQYLHPEYWMDKPYSTSGRVSRAGTDFAFREPQFFPRSVGHPDWDAVRGTPLSPLEIAGQGTKWTGVGGALGLGAYVNSGQHNPQPVSEDPWYTGMP